MRKLSLFVGALIALLIFKSGGSSSISYQPFSLLPVSFSLSGSTLSVQGNGNLVTPVGDFTIASHYQLAPTNGSSVYLVLRNSKTGYDRIFDVHTGSDNFTTVINGMTTINVTGDQILIDVTSGSIKKVTFEPSSSQATTKQNGSQTAKPSPPDWLQHEWHKPFARWDVGYDESWYHFFGLSRWAYSDTTIHRWYGIGFLWFLLRLSLTILLALIDLGLSAGLLVGQIAFLIFGPVGRDFVYVLLIVTMMAATAMGVSYLRDRKLHPSDPDDARIRSPQ
jgi:hypothetical protein